MRRILLLLSVLGVILLSYYLFFKRYEYGVSFKARTLPGDVIETIRIWNRSLGESRILQVDSFQRLKQNISVGERSYTYDWSFKLLNDSVTKVHVAVSQPGRQILNKLLIPFTEQAIETDSRDLMVKFHNVMMEHLRITSVKVIGETETDFSFCVCSSLETNQIEKANGMMRVYPPLTSFITTFGLKPAGPPLVRVKEWNHSSGTLKFDFCFPIEPMDTLPMVKDFNYERFEKVRALKAEYNGNYITSDRAWYELFHYAELNGYEIDGLPLEYFHNNPNLGIREHEWKAEVYLPIK